MEEPPNWKKITIYNKKTKKIETIINMNWNIALKDIGINIHKGYGGD